MKAEPLLHFILCACLCLAASVTLASPADYISTSSSGVIDSITYKGSAIKLGESALYVNEKLADDNLGNFAFRSLQAAVAVAKEGTSDNPTVIYLEPDVYWTDVPSAENKENKLIGLRITQANITLVGLSDNPEHTVIAGNRGQMAGAIGNWNTIGVGDGFRAYNITFGNYCNVDLVYPLNPRKNHRKRQETITQAQALTTAHSSRMDKWVFENCRFISLLNVFAAGREPERAYFKNCFFQCTDDAIGSGGMSVFEHCNFKFYSNHPSWGGSRVLQAYLGCNFETALRDAKANSTIFFAKNNAIFAVIDCNFNGNAERLEWTDILSDQARHYVHNNLLNGRPALISANKPELSVSLNTETLKAFKIGDEYNIYNLLRGDDDWDPAGQKSRLHKYSDLTYRLQIIPEKGLLDGAKSEKVKVSYKLFPARTRGKTDIKWTVSDTQLLSISHTETGDIVVTGKNTSDKLKHGYLKGETAAGIQAVAYFEVRGIPLPAPTISKAIRVSTAASGIVSVDYELTPGDKEDHSLITWYRAKHKDFSDTIAVAVSRMGDPYKHYKLSTGDIGYYLVARIEPRHPTSKTGNAVFAWSKKIGATDVRTTSISTNFKNMPATRSELIRDGFWTMDTHRPKDLSQKFSWEPAAGDGWAYGMGEVETAGRQGLYTLGRGARMLYSQQGDYEDMTLSLNLSPQKAAGQGFGSATGQYLDIYTKFDTQTLTGYGIRIERTPAYGNAVLFSLYKYENGVGIPLGPHQYTSAFLPGCQIKLAVKGNRLAAQMSTSSPQQQSQKEAGLSHEVNLSSEIKPGNYGGFGVQHTGTTGAGRLLFEELTVSYD